MGLPHRSQRFAARARQQEQQTPTGLPRPVNQVRELASKPLLQTGQARLGAFLSYYRILAFEPYAPVGQADWGRSRTGSEAELGAKPNWGRSRTGGEAGLGAKPDWPPMGLPHRSQRFAARARQQKQQTPTGLRRPVNQVRELAQ
jgi:hypothetical protein